MPPDQVTSLKIHVRQGAYQNLPVIPTFARLESFSLFDYDTIIDLDAILTRINPQHLRHLHIEAPELLATTPSRISHLPFPKLESFISLGAHITPDILSSLHLLPRLDYLALDHSPFIAQALLPMLSGPTKIPALRQLIAYESLGDEILQGACHKEDGYTYHLDEDTLSFAPVGWITSKWTADFPFPEAMEFVQRAIVNKVDPGSVLMECVMVQLDYNSELADCEEYSRSAEGRSRIAEARIRWESRLHLSF